MEHVDKARALLSQAYAVAYEAYGRYYAVNCPWEGNEVMSYHEWLERDGKYYKFLVESLKQHLTELIYERSIQELKFKGENYES